eukprot:CAMPEP_0116081362 /NCGR_PEP_ID=MMETSP0327-20121206/2158_1 /TAXON_ID=44447 /ORGANISM="Pseudo-nitzschia delicatissima, Strain B596" /LENGTH=238 /DNA_ID=CAMNT_0003572095 /DNA_START=327 /DNA_END=1040 /DNA_ORIENTATION=+
MRQLMKDNKAQNKRAFNIHRTLKAMKGNQNLVKGESTQLKTALEGYKQQLVVAKQKIDEKDRQLAQFRKMVESRSSSSSHSDNSQRKYLSGGEISGGGQRSSVSQRPRPRRVSDEHVPPPSAHSNSSHTYGYNPRGQPENRQKKLNAMYEIKSILINNNSAADTAPKNHRMDMQDIQSTLMNNSWTVNNLQQQNHPLVLLHNIPATITVIHNIRIQTQHNTVEETHPAALPPAPLRAG